MAASQSVQPAQLQPFTQAAPSSQRPAESRIGRSPSFGLSTFGTPAAAGASDTGYDSLNRKKKTVRKSYPGERKPSPAASAAEPRVTGSAATSPEIQLPPSSAVSRGPNGDNRTPVSASVAGTADGQPKRRRLKREDDPFGAVGIRSGGLLIKPAIELSGGYDTNPARASTPQGSALYVVAPELVVTSDWSRHSLTADLRGSFTGYGTTFPPPNSIPTVIDRPNFDGKVNGRLDVTRDTRVDSEARFRLGTDNPGSPSIQAGLSRYPIYTSLGGTLGLSQRFNRLDLSVKGSADRTIYTQSHLTDGTTSPNDDRNFNQFGATARATYESLPSVKPFAEVMLDKREHDLKIDRSGYQRDSVGGAVRAGSTFELSRLITGEASIGYTQRRYDDPRLSNLSGFLMASSLVWTVTPLTKITLTAKSSIDETTIPGVSGVVTRDFGVQVDHDFRRWLAASLKFGYGTSDYEGTRFDNRYSASADLIYKMTRTVHIKAQVRHEWQDSTAPGSDTAATVMLLGVRLQK